MRVNRVGARATRIGLAAVVVLVAAPVVGASAHAPGRHPAVSAVGKPLPNKKHRPTFPGKRHHHGKKRKGAGLGQNGGCPDVAGGYCTYSLTNDTPYVLNLTTAHAFWTPFGQSQHDTSFDVAPAQALQPGQRSSFTLQQAQAWDSWIGAEVDYNFADVNGGPHRVQLDVDQSYGNLSSYSQDSNGSGGWTNSTSTIQMRSHPGGSANDVDVILSHPAVAKIDAKAEPTKAAAVMAMWPNGTNKNFTPTTGVSFSQGPASRISGVVYNTTNANDTFTYTAGTTADETTSIGVKLSWSTSLDILGLADVKIGTSVTGGHSWATSRQLTNSDTETIRPGYKGWIDAQVTSATITGNFSFDINGITYEVDNASITEPGMGQNGPDGSVDWSTPIAKIAPGSPGKGGKHKRGKPRRKKHKRTRRYSRCKHYSGRIGKAHACVHWLTELGDNTVKIDAQADPKAAAAAMALWPNATNTSFTATTNPIYTNTNQQVISNYFTTPPDSLDPSLGGLSASESNSSSWSLGGSVSAETTLSVLGFANASVSVEFTAEHQWTNGTSVSQSVSATTDPGCTSWIEGYASQVTFDGDYAFTVNGVNYQVDNVRITEPGNSAEGPMAGYTYIVKDQKSQGALPTQQC